MTEESKNWFYPESAEELAQYIINFAHHNPSTPIGDLLKTPKSKLKGVVRPAIDMDVYSRGMTYAIPPGECTGDRLLAELAAGNEPIIDATRGRKNGLEK